MRGPSRRGRPVRDATRRTLRRTQGLLGDQTIFLPIVLRATPTGTARQITPSTELVIEGFPRSGNTFATFAFSYSQRRPVEVKSHVHVPSQVKLAVRRGLPTLVVIRPPVDAVTSLIVGCPHLRPRRILLDYVHHYREIIDLQDGFVIADFDQVSTNLGDVIDSVNRRFGTTFDRFEHTPDAEAEVFARIEAHHDLIHPNRLFLAPVPSELRHAAALAVRQRIEVPELDEVRARADAVYDEVMAAQSVVA